MSRFDHADLDGHLLQLLVAVIEEGSITRAAQRLDVTQSAVSHLLDKLRAITGDPLFVRSGRGIVPTARAQALAVQARVLLDGLRSFVAADGASQFMNRIFVVKIRVPVGDVIHRQSGKGVGEREPDGQVTHVPMQRSQRSTPLKVSHNVLLSTGRHGCGTRGPPNTQAHRGN